MVDLANQRGGYSNPNTNKKYSLPKLYPCNATLYVFPGNENAIDGINFLINVEGVKYGRELHGLGSLILQSDRPQKFFEFINSTTIPEAFARAVLTYSNKVIQQLQEPATILLPNCDTRFTFNNVTVVSGSPWDEGCDPRAYSQGNDRINKPRVRSTTNLEKVERLILEAVFEAICASVNGENQPRVASWPTINNPFEYRSLALLERALREDQQQI